MASATSSSDEHRRGRPHHQPPQPASNNTNKNMMNAEAALRWKHDMADAQRMMEASKKKKASNNNNRNNDKLLVTLDQVHVALDALDQAELLQKERRRESAQHQQLQQALQLYQEAIQVLLQYLRQPASPTADISNRNDMDKSTLQARIQTALTDAEQLKAELAELPPKTATTSRPNTRQSSDKSLDGKTRRKKTDKSVSPPSATTATTGGLFSLFGTNSGSNDESISSSNNKSSSVRARKPTSPSSASSAQPQSTASRATKPATTRTTAATIKSRPKDSPTSAKQTSPTSAATTSSQSARTRTTRRGSPTTVPSQPQSHKLSPQNQAMQHQILDEFYVPTSTLQKTTWDDVAGLQKVKQALQESVILPLQRPDLFTGLRRPQNLLLFGPPGTGKTLLVRATASTSNALLFQCSAASLTSKWMGDAEKVVRALFQVAAAAAEQHQTPALLFLDEVDSVLSNRSEGEHEASRRLKTEFMVQMEGLTKHSDESPSQNVLVLACTNNPWDLDAAILRRFPRRLYVPMPDAAARKALLQHLLDTQLKHDHSLSSRDVSELATNLKGYSGSDIYAIASQASFGPIRDVSASKLQSVSKLRPVSRKDWDTAIQAAPPPSVTPKHLARYKEWQTKHTT